MSYEASRNVSIHPMTPQLDQDSNVKYPTNKGQDPTNLDEPVLLKDRVIIPAFASRIVHVRTQRTFIKGHHLNIMVQPPYPEDKAKLPLGLYIQRVYTELKDGSRNVSMVLCNSTGKPMHLTAGWLVGHIVAANMVPDVVVSPELEAKLAKEGEPEAALTTEQHQELLMKVWEENSSLGKLDGWKKETALKAKRLLMEFHHIFSLERNEIGCTDTTEHIIELLPKQDELLHHGPQEWFWQVKVSEESCQYTAFMVGSMGVYEFLRMPYGLCNTPVTFQHLMQNCLGELNLLFAMVYLDNMIVYSEMPEDHLTHLQAIFDHFAHRGLKLKLSKYHFFKEEISYLGHEISAKGMLPGQKSLEEIACMGPPTTYTGIRKFIGAVGYFRRFIKNFARIAKPLNDLLGCGNSKLKNHPVLLTAAAEEAFHTLKKKCAMAPVLAFADLKKLFLLETDASKYGLGAILQQVQEDGRYHLVAYVSRAVCGSEANYHSSKLEFLALKWAMTQQFKEYLMYQPFTI